jgi:predicted Fe-Mo cluster-binding NifX family protein
MKIAVPLMDEKTCRVFGRCSQFAFLDVDMENRKIIDKKIEKPSSSKPETFPRWLSQKNIDVLIGGSVGFYTQCLFDSLNIKVVTGASEDLPERVTSDYMQGKL